MAALLVMHTLQTSKTLKRRNPYKTNTTMVRTVINSISITLKGSHVNNDSDKNAIS